jgi:hypothetical protein
MAGDEACGGVVCLSFSVISTSALLLLAGSTAARASIPLATFSGSEDPVVLVGLPTPLNDALDLGGDGVNCVGWNTSYLVDHFKVFS